MKMFALPVNVRTCVVASLLAASPVCSFANHVRVLQEGQLIKIVGDGQPNNILVAQTNAGTLTVTGRNGTRVNGQPSATIRNISINAMEVRLEGGNDQITFSNVLIANDLFLDLGSGADRILTGSLPSSVGANCNIEGGTGNDVVRLTGWMVGSDLYVNGGTGVLNANLTGLSVAFGLTVLGDMSNDVVELSGCEVGDSTSIETKAGADRVSVSDFSGFLLSANTDMGNDTVSITNVFVLEDISINTGTENDTVTMTEVTSGKNIGVSLDAGTDSFVGTGVTAAFDAVFEGGAGTDTFGDFGVLGNEKTEIKEFEILL